MGLLNFIIKLWKVEDVQPTNPKFILAIGYATNIYGSLSWPTKNILDQCASEMKKFQEALMLYAVTKHFRMGESGELDLRGNYYKIMGMNLGKIAYVGAIVNTYEELCFMDKKINDGEVLVVADSIHMRRVLHLARTCLSNKNITHISVNNEWKEAKVSLFCINNMIWFLTNFIYLGLFKIFGYRFLPKKYIQL